MQGPGWWRASDGRWYPPTPQPAAPAATKSQGGFPRRWSLWQVGLAALATLLLGLAVGAAAGSSDDTSEPVAVGDDETTAGDSDDTERSTTTAEITTTTEAELGTREAPLPVGQVATLESQGSPTWEVKVTGFNPDGTQAVLAENQFNDPPAPGHQFALVTVEATYVGTEQTDTPLGGMTFSAVDDGNVSYDFDDTCGVIPTALDNFGDVFQGGVVSGNICWSVESAHIDSLLLIVEPAFSFDAEPTFLALR